MKKKTYTRPQTTMICVEPENIICESAVLSNGSPGEGNDQPDKDEENDFWIAE